MKAMNYLSMTVILGVLAAVVFSVFKGMGLNVFLNADALVIVFGGTIVGMFLAFPVDRVKNTIKDIAASFKGNHDRDLLVQEIVECASANRTMGIRELEEMTADIKDDFLRFGLTLVVNNHSEKAIYEIMEREMTDKMINLNFSQNVLKTIARLTPSLGLTGTVISLIKLFRNFDSIDTLAPLMAVALMSTFYGVVVSNLIALPLSAKLKDYSMTSESLMNVTLEGVVAISSLEHPSKIEERLSRYDDIDEIGYTKNNYGKALAFGNTSR
ncbi:MAG: MotA/TolQ/ExbB proton channel family protein [Nitrospirae bacterium]|nr:MotA/TolQ/ExbB proton channel family protein [Nitrospirota bacterium]